MQSGVYVHKVTHAVMHRMSADAQGVLAVADMQAFLDSSAVLDDFDGHAMVAAFWQVRDPGNAGTVIRSADAAGCSAVVLVDDCVDMFNPKVVRSTAGSLFHAVVDQYHGGAAGMAERWQPALPGSRTYTREPIACPSKSSRTADESRKACISATASTPCASALIRCMAA